MKLTQSAVFSFAHILGGEFQNFSTKYMYYIVYVLHTNHILKLCHFLVDMVNLLDYTLYNIMTVV